MSCLSRAPSLPPARCAECYWQPFFLSADGRHSPHGLILDPGLLHQRGESWIAPERIVLGRVEQAHGEPCRASLIGPLQPFKGMPSSTDVTLSFAPTSRASTDLPLKVKAELRAATRKPGTLMRALAGGPAIYDPHVSRTRPIRTPSLSHREPSVHLLTQESGARLVQG